MFGRKSVENQIELPDSTPQLTYLGIVQEKKDDCGYQKSSPDKDCLDAEIGLIRTDHIRGDPLEHDAAQSE